MTDAVQQLVAKFRDGRDAPDDIHLLCDLVEAGAALAAACLRHIENFETGCHLCGHVWAAAKPEHHFEECALCAYQRAVAAVEGR